jgi:putative ABC transport system substrate-binding protein
MTTRRKVLFALGAVVLGIPTAPAQGLRKRIGVLTSIDRDKSAFFPPFVKRLADLGYTEEKNIDIDYRSSSGDSQKLPSLARAVAGNNPDLIIALGTLADARAALATKPTAPIVFIAVNYDPREDGVVASYSHPEGNVTGVYVPTSAFGAKRLELAREMLPKLNRVLVLSDPFSAQQVKLVREAAAVNRIGVELLEFKAQPYDYDKAIRGGRLAHAQALITLASPVFQSDSASIAGLCLKHRLPVFGFLELQVAAGFLATYGAEAPAISARAAAIALRILQGAHPADVPVEQANDDFIAINQKTAKALGITIPQAVMFRADRLIE